MSNIFYGGIDCKKELLDKKLNDLINKDEGIYIELGANDGLKQSNTAYFEFTRKWKGVLIEPSPIAYEKCVKNRPNSIVLNYACVSSDYNKESIKGDFNGNLMSSVNGERLKSDNQLISVKTSTLNSIIQKYLNSQQIDLLTLDAEGYEYEILKGLNLNLYRPKYILIEIYPKDYNNIYEYMISHNYTFHSNFSSFNHIDNPLWDGLHNDYLFISN